MVGYFHAPGKIELVGSTVSKTNCVPIPPPPALCGTNPFSLPVSDCVFFSFLSPPRWVGTLKRGRLFWSFSVPFFLEWKPGGVNLNGMPLGETPLDSKFGLAHASKKEDRRTVFEASSRKSELWKTSFNDPLTCDSYAQASKTSEPQCHIASLKRVLSL